MSAVRPAPVVLSVLVTEATLGVVGAEITWDAVRHVADYSGVNGLLLRSVGPPWSAPWHAALWRYNGVSTSIGFLLYLALLGAATYLLTTSVRGRRAYLALAVGIWSSSVLALSLSQLVRLLVDGGGETAYAGPGHAAVTAMTNGTAQVYHAVYFGWIAALVGAGVARLNPEPLPDPLSESPGWRWPHLS